MAHALSAIHGDRVALARPRSWALVNGEYADAKHTAEA